MIRNVAITGATGFIGGRILKKLKENGRTVISTARDVERSKKLAPDADKHLRFDPLDKISVAKALEGVDAIINLAGPPIAGGRWTPEKKEEILNGRVTATSAISAAIAAGETAPEVFISASAIGYYGDSGNRVVSESSPSGDGFLAYVCREWESAANQAESKTRVVKARIGIVLDAKEGALPKMAAPFKFFLGGRLGAGDQWISWIHIDDLVNLFIEAMDNPAYSGAVNIVSQRPVRNREFARILGRALRRPSLLPAPGFAIKALFGEAASLILTGQCVWPIAATENRFRYRFENLGDALTDIFRTK